MFTNRRLDGREELGHSLAEWKLLNRVVSDERLVQGLTGSSLNSIKHVHLGRGIESSSSERTEREYHSMVYSEL